MLFAFNAEARCVAPSLSIRLTKIVDPTKKIGQNILVIIIRTEEENKIYSQHITIDLIVVFTFITSAIYFAPSLPNLLPKYKKTKQKNQKKIKKIKITAI